MAHGMVDPSDVSWIKTDSFVHCMMFHVSVYSFSTKDWGSWSSSQVLPWCSQIPKLHIPCICCLRPDGLLSRQRPKGFFLFHIFCKTLYTMEHQQYSTVLIGIRIVYLQSYLWDQIEKANFLIAAIFVLYGWLIWLIRLSKNHINMIFVVSFFLSLSISQLPDDPFLPQTSGHPDFPLGRSTTKLTCCLL